MITLGRTEGANHEEVCRGLLNPWEGPFKGGGLGGGSRPQAWQIGFRPPVDERKALGPAGEGRGPAKGVGRRQKLPAGAQP